MIQNISVERLEEIDQERKRVFSDQAFHQWMKELRVGVLAHKPVDGAIEMMSLWTDKHGVKNSFEYVISKLK